MYKVLIWNMESFLAALFWGNLVSFLFLCLYYTNSRKRGAFRERELLDFLIFARLFHLFYCFVALGRDIYPTWFSVNLGNTLMLVGFYFEARAILKMIGEESKYTNRLLNTMLAISVILFNVIEWIMPSGGMRIAIASCCTIAIMAYPCVRMLLSRDSSSFTKSFAIIYSLFLLLLLPRAWYGFMNQDMSILTTNIVQSLAFLSLFIQLFTSLPSYVLILKEYADEALILMATTDKLTGATNRHAFLDAASAVFMNSKRFHLSLAILFMDIDFFKQVNDKYGHAFGDCVLTRLASIIDKCLRDSDLSCRYGGEEFVALLLHANYKTAQIVAERILYQVRSTQFVEHPEFSFTISIGVSCGIPYTWQSLDDVIKDADTAMYNAKEEGRNCIVFHTSYDKA